MSHKRGMGSKVGSGQAQEEMGETREDGTHGASVDQPIRLLLAIQCVPVCFLPFLSSPEKPKATLKASKVLHLLLTDGPPSCWTAFRTTLSICPNNLCFCHNENNENSEH